MAEDLTETDAWDTPITIPEDGDDRDAASVRTAFLRLTNRSKFLHTRSGIEMPGGTRHVWSDAHAFHGSVGIYDALALGPGVDPVYADAAGVPTPRLRTVQLDLYSFVPLIGTWSRDFFYSRLPIMTAASGARGVFQLDLPSGTVLHGVRAELKNTDASPGTFTLALESFAAGAPFTPTTLAGDSHAVAAGETDNFGADGSSFGTVNRSTHTYCVSVACSSGGGMIVVNRVEIDVLDIGPRSNV